MTFGQSAPPATAKQVQYLLSLVQKAGHSSFRDARGALGLTQRQSSGKFSRNEASALIDLLLGGEEGSDSANGAVSPLTGAGERISADERLKADRLDLLRGMPADLIAGELERRGWSVVAPT